jgi:hypothetical protein
MNSADNIPASPQPDPSAPRPTAPGPSAPRPPSSAPTHEPVWVDVDLEEQLCTD